MVINHAGNLKKDHFISYLKLVMNSRECTIEQAKVITIELFFNNDENAFGKETYQQFLLAYNILKEQKSH
ncbi:hypothetical protein [Radiobacillus sp. PE A8.2]|uniref:hypothetical protein n=1 Tax=Radiobacillus sp. PE A8.2 TaxID=3380349 RepID=UPI00388E63E8